jgi:hypothetical protein
MRNRRTTLLWMKDLIEHMRQCSDQLEWDPEGPASTFLTESLIVNLTECRKLCDELQDKGNPASNSRSFAVTL